MSSCHDMKKGEIYVCEECGLELKVIAECQDVETPDDECCCHDEGEKCEISCCGKGLVKK